MARGGVDLPKSELNKGIAFKAHTVKVRLTFVLDARIVDKPARAAGHLAARMRAPDIEHERHI